MIAAEGTMERGKKAEPAEVREATAEDLPSVRAILAHYVDSTCVTWREETPTLEQLAAKFASREVPWLVAVAEGELVGFAYAALFREAAGWRRTCEDTVYLKQGWEGCGIGRRLLRQLTGNCAAAGFTVVLAMISVCDGTELGQASIALHKSLGFESCGLIRRCGFKYGQWMDCAMLSLSLTLPDQ